MPLHIWVNERDERLNLSGHERLVGRADGVSTHVEDGSSAKPS